MVDADADAAPLLLPNVVVGGCAAGGVEKPPTHPGETIPAMMIAAHSSIDAVVIARGRFCFSRGRAAAIHFGARTRREECCYGVVSGCRC